VYLDRTTPHLHPERVFPHFYPHFGSLASPLSNSPNDMHSATLILPIRADRQARSYPIGILPVTTEYQASRRDFGLIAATVMSKSRPLFREVVNRYRTLRTRTMEPHVRTSRNSLLLIKAGGRPQKNSLPASANTNKDKYNHVARGGNSNALP